MRRITVFLVGILLAAGTVACGGDDVPPEVTSAVENLTQAINTYDTEAFLNATTEDFTWQSTGDVQSRPEFAEYFEANYEASQFKVEATGDLTVEQDGEAHVAQEPGRVTSTGYDADGRSVYRVVEVDGTWLVQELRWHEDAADG